RHWALKAAASALAAALFDPSSYYTKGEVDGQISGAIADLLNGAPGALDTLSELAAALGNDEDFATTVTNALAQKADASTVTTALAALSPLVTTAANVNAVAGQRIWCDTSGGVATVTLPAAPDAGALIEIVRLGGNGVTIARNGKTIAGAP